MPSLVTLFVFQVNGKRINLSCGMILTFFRLESIFASNLGKVLSNQAYLFPTWKFLFQTRHFRFELQLSHSPFLSANVKKNTAREEIHFAPSFYFSPYLKRVVKSTYFFSCDKNNNFTLTVRKTFVSTLLCGIIVTIKTKSACDVRGETFQN